MDSFGKHLGPLIKIDSPLMIIVLMLLGLTGAASAVGAGIQKKIFESGCTLGIV